MQQLIKNILKTIGNKMDKTDIFCLAVIILIVGVLMGSIGFVLGYCANEEVIEVEKIVEVEVNNLDWCLEQVKDIDLFEKELYDKEWMSK